jgi:hypothetical protein
MKMSTFAYSMIFRITVIVFVTKIAKKNPVKIG